MVLLIWSCVVAGLRETEDRACGILATFSKQPLAQRCSIGCLSALPACPALGMPPVLLATSVHAIIRPHGGPAVGVDSSHACTVYISSTLLNSPTATQPKSCGMLDLSHSPSALPLQEPLTACCASQEHCSVVADQDASASCIRSTTAPQLGSLTDILSELSSLLYESSSGCKVRAQDTPNNSDTQTVAGGADRDASQTAKSTRQAWWDWRTALDRSLEGLIRRLGGLCNEGLLHGLGLAERGDHSSCTMAKASSVALQSSDAGTDAPMHGCGAPQSPLLLVLAPDLHDLPWESVPCLEDHGVFRMLNAQLAVALDTSQLSSRPAETPALPLCTLPSDRVSRDDSHSCVLTDTSAVPVSVAGQKSRQRRRTPAAATTAVVMPRTRHESNAQFNCSHEVPAASPCWNDNATNSTDTKTRVGTQSGISVQSLNADARATIGDNTVDARRVVYLVDPVGDLPSTSRHFEAWFSGIQGWLGSSGSPAMEKDTLLQEMLQRSLFVYLGHGAGKHFALLQ